MNDYNNKQNFKRYFSPNDGSKNKMPPVHQMCEEKWYTFSYNPEVQPVLYNGTVEYGDWLMEQRRHLSEYDKTCSLQLFMDISTSGRLHWHGIIKIHNLKNFMIFTLPLIIKRASTEIDFLTDPVEWHNYCTKTLHILDEYYITQPALAVPEEIQEDPSPFSGGSKHLPSEKSSHSAITLKSVRSGRKKRPEAGLLEF